ncbi:hypothetical protein [Psychromonas sp. MME2]|uniref:hypothetical protein n=1 Tax=Psychromonas sp. MME2 TaxID=3231033 RepID=UPI00339CAAEF
MLLFPLLSDLDCKVILFTYEKRFINKKSLSLDLLDDDFRSFIITEGDYILWELEKRKLTETEVVAHSWLVTSQKNQSILLKFEENNCLYITSVFDKEDYHGHWKLEHGILKVYFNYHEHKYDINIIANNNSAIHSALQIVDEANVDVLKVAPLSQARYGKALLE